MLSTRHLFRNTGSSLRECAQKSQLKQVLGGAGSLTLRNLHSAFSTKHNLYNRHRLSTLEFARSFSSHVHTGSGTKQKSDSASTSGAFTSEGEVSKKDKAIGGFKELWRKYGVVAMGTYLGIYVGSLGLIFLSLDYDIFNAATFGMDPQDAIRKVADIIEATTGSKSFPSYIKDNPRAGTFAIAWVMTKFTEPIRFFLTVGIVPPLSRFLGFSPPKESK